MIKSPAVGSEFSIIDHVEQVRSGNMNALPLLIDCTSATVTSIALAIVRDIDIAEDVAQQVYIKVWQQIKTLKNSKSFMPWLRQVTRNTAFNFLRDNKVARFVSKEDAERLLSEYSDLNQDQDELLLRRQQGTIISGFIDALPDEDREVILLYYREGESSKRVAKLLDLSEANVRKKLSRTRANLKVKILAKCGNLLTATAPVVGFGSILIPSITASSPVAAMTITTMPAGHTFPLFSKVLLVLGGAVIGALSAAAGILLGSFFQLKNISDPTIRHKLISIRNKYIVFLMAFGIGFAMSYEFTSGWWAPTVCYSIFAASLVYFTITSNKIVSNYHASSLIDSDKQSNHRRKQILYSTIGLIVGLTAGYFGLIIGFLNSGRLVL